MPAKVLAVEPPLTWSSASLNKAPNSAPTLAPAGLGLSSSTAPRLAVPDRANGASLTAATVKAEPDTPPLNAVLLGRRVTQAGKAAPGAALQSAKSAF